MFGFGVKRTPFAVGSSLDLVGERLVALEQIAQNRFNLKSQVRLRNEPGSVRQIGLDEACLSRGHEDGYCRPTITDQPSKFHAIYLTWHLNVREHCANIAAGFQRTNRFVSTAGPDGFKSAFLDNGEGGCTDKLLIFHHKHNRVALAIRSTHLSYGIARVSDPPDLQPRNWRAGS